MFRGRALMLIALSLVIAAGATVAASRWLQSRALASQQGRPQTETVVTAAMDIPFGTKVEERHLASIEMIQGTAPRGVVHKKEDVMGKVSGGSLLAGELLIAERFAEQGQGSTLAAVVEKNMRAITVRVNDVVGVGGFLLPGNRVDLLATRDFNGRMEAETRTILQNVKVLAVDQTASTDKNEPVVVRAVTLEVKPDDAELLTKAMAEGSIQLTLRNPLDDTAPVVAKAEPKPAPAPRQVARIAPPPSVMVIRGTQVNDQPSKR
jgi:pilus assembly protein CpaB